MKTSPNSEIMGANAALICIPTYNERDNVEPITKAVRSSVPDAHVLIVDDNSPDGTGAIADRLAQEDAQVHVLHRKGKEGLGKAYLAAFAWALDHGFDVVFELDADFSHDPKYLPEFVETLRSGRADVLVGSRRVAGGGVENWGPVRRFVSWGGSTYARTVLGLPIRDLTGGFNGFRGEVLAQLDLDTVEATGYAFQIELKHRAFRRGFKVVERAIIFPDRRVGQSKMSSKIFLEAMWMVWKLRFSKEANRTSARASDVARG